MCKFVKGKHLLVNENVGLLMAKKRMETRDGLNMPVYYVMQRKKSLNV